LPFSLRPSTGCSLRHPPQR